MFSVIIFQIKTNWVAIIGAVTGITGLLLSLLNYYRDRAKIKINFKTGWRFIGPVAPYKNNVLYDCITVINVGRRSIKIEKAGACVKKTEKGNQIIISDSMMQFKNRILTEENPSVDFYYESSVKSHDDIYYFVIYDGKGKKYRKWIHPYKYFSDRIKETHDK